MSTSNLLRVVIVLMLTIMTSTVHGYETATSFQFPLQTWNVGCNNFWGTCVISNAHHLGEDVGASATTPVYCPANGKVKEAQSHDGYGGTVLIEHYTGSEYVVSIIGHLKASTLAVSDEEEVSKGQLIGYVGTSAENGGWSEHVHFGIHKGQYQTGNSCDNHWVYAGYDYSANGCTQNNWYVPSDFVNSHQYTYSCLWHTQDPNAAVEMYPGETGTFTVAYRNEGNTTWKNDPTTDPDYIELRSCDSAGSIVNSWLYPGNTWTNAQRVVAPNASTVQHGENAWFIFPVKVPDNAAPGDYKKIYFRPYHNSCPNGIEDRGGMCFHIKVIDPSSLTGTSFQGLSGDFNGDGIKDVCQYEPVTGNWYVSLKDPASNHFIRNSHPWLTDCDADLGFPEFVGDFNGDGWDDIASLNTTAGRWWVCFNDHQNHFVCTGSYWADNWDAGYSFPERVGDFNHDGWDDIASLNTAAGRWWVGLNDHQNHFVCTGTYWVDNWSAGYTFPEFVGDFNGDGWDDVADLNQASGRWWVGLNDHQNHFVCTGTYWVDNWSAGYNFPERVGDFNHDGWDDIADLNPASGRWWVGLNDHQNHFVCTGTYWVDNWSTGYSFPEFVGDLDGDGWDDVMDVNPASGRWWVGLSDHQNHFVCTGTYWLDEWGIQTGWEGKLVPQASNVLPRVFSLSQNYPNPFNPLTVISYSLPNAADVKLSVINMLGQTVKTLLEADQTAGEHSFRWDASEQSSGVYFYKIEAGGLVETRKMLLLK